MRLKRIDPTDITDYERDDRELQHFWLFCIAAAGKNANRAASSIANLLGGCAHDVTPFDYLEMHRDMGSLVALLQQSRTGQYTRLYKAFTESFKLDLRHATVEELDAVYGVGLKTAKLFILHTRPNVICSPLDTHILTWLNSLGIGSFPETSPQRPDEYRRVERIFVAMARLFFPSRTFAEIDLHLWKVLSGRDKGRPPTFDDLSEIESRPLLKQEILANV